MGIDYEPVLMVGMCIEKVLWKNLTDTSKKMLEEDYGVKSEDDFEKFKGGEWISKGNTYHNNLFDFLEDIGVQYINTGFDTTVAYIGFSMNDENDIDEIQTEVKLRVILFNKYFKVKPDLISGMYVI